MMGKIRTTVPVSIHLIRDMDVDSTGAKDTGMHPIQTKHTFISLSKVSTRDNLWK